MYNHLLYFCYWFVNSFVISLLYYLNPLEYSLGNWKFTALEASIYSGFWITFVVWIFWDYLMAKDIKIEGIKNWLWFWFANIIGIWITARMTNFTGLSIENLFAVIILALFTNLLQKTIRIFVINK